MTLQTQIATTIEAQPITAQAFAPFGELVEPGLTLATMINDGLCARYSGLACLDAQDGHIGVSLFQADLRPVPHTLDLLERHPMGSQCFLPLGGSSYLVIVAHDEAGRPGTPQAFLAGPEQPVNIARNVWHGVLTPISGSGLFAVLDRFGPGQNLEEHRLEDPVLITLPGKPGERQTGGPING